MSWHEKMPLEYRNAIVTGDARELAKRIPDESMDLIFTDPVYDRIDDYRWLAETAARVLRPDSSLLVWCALRTIFETRQAMECLDYGWLIVWYQANGRSFIKSDLGHHHWSPLLWMRKGHGMPTSQVRDHITTTWNGDDFTHAWSKHPDVIAYYLNAFPGIVYDPFCGGGTVPAVCKMLGRNYVASEICPDVAERARQRVLNTQPPLFVLQPEQVEMPLCDAQ